VIPVVVLPWQSVIAPIDQLNISVQDLGDQSASTTHMGHKDSDHKRNQQGISVEDDDFNRMDDAQPLAEGVLIVHTVKKRVIGCKHAINYMGIQRVIQRQNMGQDQSVSITINT
jgi:hypothetical protein